MIICKQQTKIWLKNDQNCLKKIIRIWIKNFFKETHLFFLNWWQIEFGIKKLLEDIYLEKINIYQKKKFIAILCKEIWRL